MGVTSSGGRAEPRPGAMIAGRFQVDRLIARGGMSTVYLAHQVRLNRPVALKVLTPPPTSEEAVAFEQRFRREGQALASLDHPNIVVLYDYGETEDGRFYLAMEYIDGPRLSDLLKEGPLPAQRALGIIVQVAAGLRYAHKLGVVHRDLKPSNLLVRVDDEGKDQVKIVDFGLVKLTDVDQNITRAGLILGSPHCMSPEQVKGLEVDHRADIYAMGVLLFRCLTGQYPFHGTNSAATMVAHLNHPIPTFYSVSPELEVPAGLEEVVRRCLAKSPDDRYGDMRQVITDLTALMDAPPEGVRTFGSHSSLLQPAISSVQHVSQSGAYTPILVPVSDGRRNRALFLALVGAAVLFFMLVGVGMGALTVGGLLELERSRSAPPSHYSRTESALIARDPVLPPQVAPERGAPERVAPERVAPPAPLPVAMEPPPVVAVEPPRAARAPVAPPPRAKPLKTRAGSPSRKAPSTSTDPQVVPPEGYMGLPDDLLQ